VEYTASVIARNRVPRQQYEFQMLLGIRRDLQRQVFEDGHPLRVYVPWGTAWCPYFMRRLAERPANMLFVLQSLLAERPAARGRAS
jgi:proline dehydrogenase